LVLLGLLILPFVIVFWFIVYVFKIWKDDVAKVKNWILRGLLYVYLLCLAIMVDIIIVPLTIIALPIVGFYLLYKECKERKKLSK